MEYREQAGNDVIIISKDQILLKGSSLVEFVQNEGLWSVHPLDLLLEQAFPKSHKRQYSCEA